MVRTLLKGFLFLLAVVETIGPAAEAQPRRPRGYRPPGYGYYTPQPRAPRVDPDVAVLIGSIQALGAVIDALQAPSRMPAPGGFGSQPNAYNPYGSPYGNPYPSQSAEDILVEQSLSLVFGLMREAMSQAGQPQVPFQNAPQSASDYTAMAAYQSGQGDLRGAIQSLRQAVSMDPRDEIARSDLAEMYEKAGDDRAALEEYKEVTKLNPKSAHGFYRQAVIQCRQGDFKSATLALERAVQLDFDLREKALHDPDLEPLKNYSPYARPLS